MCASSFFYGPSAGDTSPAEFYMAAEHTGYNSNYFLFYLFILMHCKTNLKKRSTPPAVALWGSTTCFFQSWPEVTPYVRGRGKLLTSEKMVHPDCCKHTSRLVAQSCKNMLKLSVLIVAWFLCILFCCVWAIQSLFVFQADHCMLSSKSSQTCTESDW